MQKQPVSLGQALSDASQQPGILDVYKRQVTDQREISVVLIVGEAVLVHVGGIDDGLQAQQFRRLDDGPVVLVALEGTGRLAAVPVSKMRRELRQTELDSKAEILFQTAQKMCIRDSC